MGWLTEDDDVTTNRVEFNHASLFAVEVGTTGPKGGDAGHGSRVHLKLEDLGGTAWEVEVDGHTIENPTSVTLTFGGDAEGTNCVKALEVAALLLRQDWPG
jgi:hypothetical protein